MRTYAALTTMPRALNCTFRLQQVEPSEQNKQRRTPDYIEIPLDCDGVIEPVTHTLLRGDAGRLIEIDKRLWSQMTDMTALPEVNARVRMLSGVDASNNLYTIKSCERYGEQFWEMLLERYID